MTEVEARAIKVISEYLNTKKLRANTTFAKLGADSLDLVELIMLLEAEFDIEIPDRETGEIKTVRDLIKLVERQKT